LHGKLYMGFVLNFNCKALVLRQWQLEGFAALDGKGKAGQPAWWGAVGLSGRQATAEGHPRKLTQLAAASN